MFERDRFAPVAGVGDEAVTVLASLLAVQGDKAVFVMVALPPLQYMPAGSRGEQYAQQQRLRAEKAIAVVLLATV